MLLLMCGMCDSLFVLNKYNCKMASKQGYGADLRKFMDLRVDLRLNGERRIAGKLKGYDQFMNIVLDEAIELI